MSTASAVETQPRPVPISTTRRAHGLVVPATLLAVLLIIGVWYIDHLGRGLTFFYDEWDVVLGRRHFGAAGLLKAHNGHLWMTTFIVFDMLFAVVGARHYHAFRLAGIGAHVIAVTALFVYARRRIGTPAALCLAAVGLMLGTGWQNILWPFQIGFILSVTCAIVALLALDSPGRRSGAVAAAALTIGLASSGLGISALAAVGVELLATKGALARRWHVVAVPAVLYGIWYLTYGQSEGDVANLRSAGSYTVNAAGAAVAGLANRSPDLGRFLAGVLAALTLLAIARRRTSRPRLLALATLPLSFWLLAAYARGGAGEPGASRYVYIGGFFILLLLAELLGDWARARVVSAGLAVLAVLAISSNLTIFRRAAGGLRDTSAYVSAELGALQLARATAAPSLQPDPVRAPQVRAGPYFVAIDDLGSPAAGPDVIAAAAEPVRTAADHVLANAHSVLVTPFVAGTSPLICSSQEGAGGATIDLAPGSAIVVTTGATPAELDGRRFADATEVLANLPPGSVTRVDTALRGWHVRVVAGANVPICRLTPGP